MDDDSSDEMLLKPTYIRRISPYSICVPVFCFILNIQMILTIQPQWLILRLCSKFAVNRLNDDYLPDLFYSATVAYSPEWDYCRAIPEIQSMAAKWAMLISLASSIPSLFLGPIYGSLSDRIGRKPIIILPLCSVFIFLLAYITVDIFDMGLWVLLVAAILIGMSGGFLIMMTITMSYFADTTNQETRASIFVFGEFIFLSSSTIGPLIGGIIARNFENGIFKLFSISFILNLVLFAATILFLPESLDNVANLTSLDFDFEGPFKNGYDFLRKVATPMFIAMLLVLCLQHVSLSVRSLLFNYVSYMFGWDSQTEGQFLLVGGFFKMIILLFVFPLVSKIFKTFQSTLVGKSSFDLAMIRFALLMNMLAFYLYAVSNADYYYFITILESIGALAPPALRSFLSLSVGKQNQGLLFSCISFADHFVSMITGVVFPLIWTNTVKTQPNAFLYSVSGVFFTALLILMHPSVEKLVEDPEQ